MKLTAKLLLCVGLFAFYTLGFCDESPSSEAMTACADKEEGDACEFMNKAGTSLDGFCKVNANSQSKLVCVASQ